MIVINSSIRCNNTFSSSLFAGKVTEKQFTSRRFLGIETSENFIRHRQQGSTKLTSKEVAQNHEPFAWWTHKQEARLVMVFQRGFQGKIELKTFHGGKGSFNSRRLCFFENNKTNRFHFSPFRPPPQSTIIRSKQADANWLSIRTDAKNFQPIAFIEFFTARLKFWSF